MFDDPNKLADVSGDELYEYLLKNGYDVKPLNKGNYKGIPFEEGGGFKVNWGGEIESYNIIQRMQVIMVVHTLKSLPGKRESFELN